MGTLITLRSSDGPLLTIIDSASNAIELALNDNAVVTIDGFTITGATSTTTDNGDGIFVYDNDGGDLEDVNVTISNNIITGNEGNGILFGNVIAGNAQVTIEGNIISNNGFGGGLFSEGEGAEIEDEFIIIVRGLGNGISFMGGMGSTVISDNTITENSNNGVYVMHTKDNFDGPYVENDAQLMTDMIQGGLPTVSPCNDIYDNLNYGVLNSSVLVLNEDGIISVDATRNWWGDASGPSGVGPGTGDEVSDNVDYKPWLRAPCGFVTCIPPQADFTAQPTRGTAPLNVEFTDESTGTISQWQWDFGDGNTSDEQNPTHRYLRPGRYTVTLEVSSGCGADIETKQNYIFVLGVAEEAELAKLTTTRIDVRPTEVVPNQQVQISVNVVNNGDTRVSDSVDLYINGYQEDSRSVGVSPGASQTVTFTVAKATPGTYEVVVGINRGWFTVIGNSNSSNPGTATGGGGPGTVGLIAIIVAAVGAGLGIFFATRAREA